MADAILAKGMSRPIDKTPTDNSTNLVTSGGVKKALDDLVTGDYLDEIHIGDSAPTSEKVTVWIDTNNVEATANAPAAILNGDLHLYVDPTSGNNINGDGSLEKPFLTITKALGQIPTNINNKDVVIEVPSFENSEEVITVKNYIGGSIQLVGAGETVVDVVIDKLEVCNSTLKFDNINLDVNDVNCTEKATIIFNDNTIIVNGDEGIVLDLGSQFITTENTTVNVANVNSTVKADHLSEAFIGNLSGKITEDNLVAKHGSKIIVKAESPNSSISKFNAVLFDDKWEEDTDGSYTQSCSVKGILSTDMPHVYPTFVFLIANDDLVNQKMPSWNMIYEVIADDDLLTFKAKGHPTETINIHIEIFR